MTRLALGSVILASSSRTRRQMLEQAGVAVEAVAPRVDEEEIRESMVAVGADGAAVAEVLAERKAAYVSRRRPRDLVIGADQVLECDGRIYSKPADREAARRQLLELRGREHALISCACAFRGEERLWHQLDRARLTMRPCSEAFIDAYLDAVGDIALEGPGAYRVEGIGAQLFSRIAGNHFTILGLPLIPLLDYLRLQGMLRS